MDELLAYINSLSPVERDAYANRCGTSIGYLRKAASVGQPLRESLCIELERESGAVVRCERLRPDVDWSYIRGTAHLTTAPAKAGA